MILNNNRQNLFYFSIAVKSHFIDTNSSSIESHTISHFVTIYTVLVNHFSLIYNHLYTSYSVGGTIHVNYRCIIGIRYYEPTYET